MSKRLQVVMDEDDLEAIRAIAEREGMTVSAWVRRTIHEARRAEGAVDPGRKLEVIRAASRHDFPTAEMEAMLDEIAQGYLTAETE